MALKWVGLLLAGGQSTRMGVDKAFLQWKGQPLIDHQIETLQSLTEETWVSGHRPGYRDIADEVFGRGPVEGLRSALRRLPKDIFLLVLPLDMPNLSVSTLMKLKTPSDGDVVRFRGHELPMVLREPEIVLKQIEQLGDNPRGLSFRALYASLRVTEVDGGHEFEFMNTNTMEAWSEALRAADPLAPNRN